MSLAAAASSIAGQHAADLLQQSSAVHAARASVQQDWWRCTLSGKVMRDPVLYGIGGHSFERAILEGVAGCPPWSGPAQQADAAKRGKQWHGAKPRPAQHDPAAAAKLTRTHLAGLIMKGN